MSKGKKKIFWIKLKPYEPDNKGGRFKPAFIKGVVYAMNAKDAEKCAYDEHINMVKESFPEADLKVVECKHLNADFSISA